MFRFIQSYIADFLDLLFPCLCLGCKQTLSANEKVLCVACRIKLPETNQHEDPYNQNLLNKFAGKVPIQFVVSFLYFSRGNLVQKLIHQIKYRGQKEAAREIATWYGLKIKSESQLSDEIDVIVGVPLHKSRLQQRGYNQADWIAEGIAEALDLPARTDILIRKHFKESQTHKNRLERWENVRDVFAVAEGKENELEGKRIALVDDVLTTGSTLEACAAELVKAGCKSVGIITIAATHR